MENKFNCHISKKILPESDLIKVEFIKDAIFELIKKEYPDISKNDSISISLLNEYRKRYLQKLINDESGQLDEFEAEVVQSISQNKIITENISFENEKDLTLGQRLADKIAEFGGSWYFIVSFFIFMLIWIMVNVFFLASSSFDPYPFILLNLILSCLAALQAPIIMMSQNRQDEKDRIRSQQDYKVNLKAELEIKLLHDKMDHLIKQQNKKLLEIQEIQADYLEDIMKLLKK